MGRKYNGEKAFSCYISFCSDQHDELIKIINYLGYELNTTKLLSSSSFYKYAKGLDVFITKEIKSVTYFFSNTPRFGLFDADDVINYWRRYCETCNTPEFSEITGIYSVCSQCATRRIIDFSAA